MKAGMQSIKFEKVIIYWQDINGGEAWNTKADVDNLTVADCCTIGYIYSETKSCIKTFATYSICADGSIDYGDIVAFPRGCVTKIERLDN